MIGQARQIYEFGPFRLIPEERQLLRDGQPVSLTPKAFDLLLALVQQSGHLVEKDELMRQVWPDRFVEEANLSVKMSELRRALGEGSKDNQYIETVPRRGYRFATNVRQFCDDGIQLIPQQQTKPSFISEEEERTNDYCEDKISSNAGRRRGLRRLEALAASLVLAGLAVAAFYLWLSSKPKSPVNIPPIRSIAVLPFKPLVADSRDEPLEFGMAEMLITRLSVIKEIKVPPLSAVRKYATLEQDPIAAGRELDVETVLDANIQRSGDRVRVTVRLLSVANGSTLWAYKYDEQWTEILVIQDSISEKVARSLTLQITGEERELLFKPYTRSEEALSLYMHARFYNEKKPEEMYKGIEYYQQAIEKDPSFALAYTGLAERYVLSIIYDVSLAGEAFSKAETAVIKALEMDKNIAEAHATLGFIRHAYNRDSIAAEYEFEIALNLNPNCAIARRWYSAYLISVGRVSEGIAEIKRAQELDPLSFLINKDVGRALYFARRYDDAIALLHETAEMYPDFSEVCNYLTCVYEKKGMYREAVEFDMRDLAVNLVARKFLPHAILEELRESYTVLGWDGYWRKRIEISMRLRTEDDKPYYVAQMFARLEAKNAALDWLEIAYITRSVQMVWLNVDPAFDNLRLEPRFAELVRRVGLTQ